jgi:hypothetical protein
MAVQMSEACHAPATARAMAEAATRFVASLTPIQRGVATFPFEGDERYIWAYTPVQRNGLLLKHMTATQRDLALALFDTGLSARGADTARKIIDLEPILREAEYMEGFRTRWDRDPELYYFSVFGQPGGGKPWAWRAGGHHIGLHFTVVGNEWVSPNPLFFGANPAQVRHGPSKGFRALAAEEDLARALLASLGGAERDKAVVDPVAPADILTRNYRTADRGVTPVGLAYADMNGEQRSRLVALVRHYVERTNEEIAGREWARVEGAGLEPITFAWAGPDQPGQGHYYAVRGPEFLIEYDNTQNGANHIHSVFRDYANDWAEDLLASHYTNGHHSR